MGWNLFGPWYRLKYTGFFALIAGLCLYLMVTAPGFASSAVFAYLAVAPLWLMTMYAANRPEWYLKKPDGSLHPICLLFCLPYNLLNAILLRVARYTGLVQGPVDITPEIWIGPRPLRADRRRMPGFHGVIDLAGELPEIHFLRRCPEYRSIPVLDCIPPSIEQFEGAFHFAEEVLACGKLYIHCASGHGRSVAVLMGLLVRLGEADTPESALRLIQQYRPKAKPTVDQWNMLEKALTRCSRE